MSIAMKSGDCCPTWFDRWSRRLACIARTPSTKKQPIPTDMRMTRDWLPGRVMLTRRAAPRTTDG
jgi:hypothetical protein